MTIRDRKDKTPLETRRERNAYAGVEDPSVIKETVLSPSTIETIDFAMNNWLEKELNLHAETNKGWKKVPVIWLQEERAYQIKNNREYRDIHGSIIFPSITIERTGMNKDPERKAGTPGNIPAVPDAKGGSVVIARRINHQKTSNFQNADMQRTNSGGTKDKNDRRQRSIVMNYSGGKMTEAYVPNKVVYETLSIPMPVYIDLTYTVTVQTEYQEQMNDLVQPFIVYPGGINYFLVSHDGHRYEAFMQPEFGQENNISNYMEEEKKYVSKVEVQVLGYLIGAGKNQKQPRIVVRENVVDIKMPRERLIFRDEPEWQDAAGNKGWYRES